MSDETQELEERKPVLLGHAVDTGEAVELSYLDRRLGTYIVGLAGMGKTSALLNLAMQDIDSGHGLCAIDPQGKWIEDILVRIPPSREQDIIYIDPSEKNRPIGLHLFECADPDDDDLVDRVMSQVVKGVFEEIWGEMRQMPRMADVLRVACRTLIRCQSLPDERLRPTLREMPWLLRNKAYRGSLLAHIRDRYPLSEFELLEWWKGYEAKGGYRQDEQIASTLNKVQEFSQSAMVKRVVGQGESTVDFRKAMDDGRIVLVDLAEGKIEREVASLIGALVISRIHIAAKSRVELLKEGKPLRRFHLLVDEFQNFATYAFAKLQDECRQYAVDITIAHQNRKGQLSEETRVQASTLGTTNWIVFRANPADAGVLAMGFSTEPPEPEVRGEREPLGYASYPWDALKRKAHESQEVTDLVHEIDSWLTTSEDGIDLAALSWMRAKLEHQVPALRKITKWSGTDDRGVKQEVWKLKVWPFKDEKDRSVFEKLLNAYLYKAMSGRTEKELSPLLFELGERLFRYRVRSPFSYPGLNDKWLPVEKIEKWETLDVYVYIPRLSGGKDPQLSPDRGITAIKTLVNEFAEAVAEDSQCSDDYFNHYKKLKKAGRLGEMEVRMIELSNIKPGVLTALARVGMRVNMIGKIEELGFLLRELPVYVRGGQPVTDYEPTRQRADIAKEHENQLVRLPQYAAFCRVQEDRGFREAQIHTVNAHNLWPARTDDPTNKIREASRINYGRDRAEVEQMLAARLRLPKPRTRKSRQVAETRTIRVEGQVEPEEVPVFTIDDD